MAQSKISGALHVDS